MSGSHNKMFKLLTNKRLKKDDPCEPANIIPSIFAEAARDENANSENFHGIVNETSKPDVHIEEKKLLRALEESQASLSKKSQILLETLEAELLPSTQFMDELSQTVDDARELREKLINKLSAYPEVSFDVHMSFGAMREVVERLHNNAEKHKIFAYARSVLGDFLRIHSEVPRYESILTVEREKIAAYTDEELQRLISEDRVSAYETFLRAIAAGASDETIENDLAPLFGDTLALAIATKKLFLLPDGASAPLAEMEAPERTGNDAPRQAAKETPAQAEEELPVSSETMAVLSEEGVAANDHNDDYAFDLQQYGIVLPDDADFGTLEEYEAYKTPKGIKAFLNDMGKKQRPFTSAAREVAHYLLSRRAVAKQEIPGGENGGEHDSDSSNVTAALRYFEKEGFVTRYTVGLAADQSFYSITPAGLKVLTSDKSKSFFFFLPRTVAPVHGVYSAADYYRLLCMLRFSTGYYNCQDNEEKFKELYDFMELHVAEIDELSIFEVLDGEFVQAIVVPCMFSRQNRDMFEALMVTILMRCEPETRVIIFVDGEKNAPAWSNFFRDELAEIVPPEQVSAFDWQDAEKVAADIYNDLILLESDDESGDTFASSPEPAAGDAGETEAVLLLAKQLPDSTAEHLSPLAIVPQAVPDTDLSRPDTQTDTLPKITDAYLAAQKLLARTGDNAPPVTDVAALALNLAECEQWGDLLALTKSFSFSGNAYASLHRRFAYALDLPWEKRRYTSASMRFLDTDLDELFNVLPQDFLLFSSCAILARACFSPDMQYDHSLFISAKRIMSEMTQVTQDMSAIRTVFKLFEDVCNEHPSGFSRHILQTLLNDKDRLEKLSTVRRSAEDLLTIPNFNIAVKGQDALSNNLFGQYSHSKVYPCLEIISENIETRRDEVKAFFQRFVAPDSPVPKTPTYDSSMVDAYILETWSSIKNKNVNNDDLSYKLRDIASRNLIRRLDVIHDWLALTATNNADNGSLGTHLSRLKSALANAVQSLHESLDADLGSLAGRMLLRRTLLTLQSRLTGVSGNEIAEFITLLQTPYIGLDKKGLPAISDELRELPGFEPWRLALRHIASERIKPKTALIYIDDPEKTEWFSNLGVAEHLQTLYSPDAAEYKDYSQSIPHALREAENAAKELRACFGLDYMNGCVDEQTIESVLAMIAVSKERLVQCSDFARFHMFLGALREWTARDKARKSENLRTRLQDLHALNGTSEVYEQAVALAERTLNKGLFAVAEDYINRLESNDISFAEETSSVSDGADVFESFLSVYNKLYDECVNNKNRDFAIWAYRSIESIRLGKTGILPDRWAKQHERSAKSFIGNWLTSGGSQQQDRIERLLKGISDKTFGSVTFQNGGRCELYEAKTNHAPKDQADYDHPISHFGTMLPQSIRIAAVYGTSSAEQIHTRIVNDMRIDGEAIVLVDGALSLKERHELACRFKASMSGTILVLDRVLMLYLATRYDTERMRTLLACSLPYAYYIPYSQDGAPVTDEMFVGRKTELSGIRSMTGTSFVYGGRQLGKTALLFRACSIEHDPLRRAFALYIPIEKLSVEQLPNKLSDELIKVGVLPKVGDYSSVEKICFTLRQQFESKRIDKLLIGLDEADKFLNEDMEAGFPVLQQFVNLRQQTTNRFKCVFAGLHDVMRSAKEIPNSPLVKLGSPLCIKPLSQMDAQRLVRYPLTFLGYKVGDESLATILSATNYYPGVIHMFCQELIKDISAKYGNYNKAGELPFILSDRVLGGIISSADLNGRVREKIRKTLESDERYKKLANLIAYMCYETSEERLCAFSPRKIYDTAKKEGIDGLSDCTFDMMSSLLDELCEMGILFASTTNAGYRYRFRKNTFLGMIGDRDEVLKVLLEVE